MSILKTMHLFNGLNIHPIPLEYSQGVTTTEWLGAIQAKINELINMCNQSFIEYDKITDNKILSLKNELILSLNNTNGVIDETIKRVGVLEAENKKADVISEYIQQEINPHLYNIDEDIKKLYVECSDLNVDIIKKYNSLIELIKNTAYVIYSPIDGNLKNVTNVLKEIVELLQLFRGITWNDIEKTFSNNNTIVNCVTWDCFVTQINNRAEIMHTWDCFCFNTSNFMSIPSKFTTTQGDEVIFSTTNPLQSTMNKLFM